MTKVSKISYSFIAIILCIFIIVSSVCSFARITDMENGNAQFFAANFSLVFAPLPMASLSSGSGLRIVSWIKKQDFTIENEFGNFFKKADFLLTQDKPECKTYRVKGDLYDIFKTTFYFIRI